MFSKNATSKSLIEKSNKFKSEFLTLKTGLEGVNEELTSKSLSIDEQIKALKEEKTLVDREKSTNIKVVENVDKILGIEP